MKYVICFKHETFDQDFTYAAGSNFDKLQHQFDEEHYANTGYKVAIISDINVAYRMKQYAEMNNPRHIWKIREK